MYIFHIQRQQCEVGICRETEDNIWSYVNQIQLQNKKLIDISQKSKTDSEQQKIVAFDSRWKV